MERRKKSVKTKPLARLRADFNEDWEMASHGVCDQPTRTRHFSPSTNVYLSIRTTYGYLRSTLVGTEQPAVVLFT